MLKREIIKKCICKILEKNLAKAFDFNRDSTVQSKQKWEQNENI